MDIKTEWIVITGGPCSGKTTIIEELAKQDYLIAEEVARSYYLEVIKYKDTRELLKHPRDLQDEILAIELVREKQLAPEELVFLDRALPDSIAYYGTIGDVPDYVRQACQTFRYKQIFFMEQLPFENDDIRHEDEAMARKISQLILDAYSSFGYHPILVPPLSIERRLNMILEHIKN
ncbi:MAG: AAA family ATPase [Gammaproteobacteria bacterium]